MILWPLLEKSPPVKEGKCLGKMLAALYCWGGLIVCVNFDVPMPIEDRILMFFAGYALYFVSAGVFT